MDSGQLKLIDVIEQLGREYIPVVISKIVRLLKGTSIPKKA